MDVTVFIVLLYHTSTYVLKQNTLFDVSRNVYVNWVTQQIICIMCQ